VARSNVASKLGCKAVPGGNNRAFLAATVIMATNESLSIPNLLKVERSDDYYKNVAMIEMVTWSLRARPTPPKAVPARWVVFKDGANVATAKEFVRFLVAEGWLIHYLNFSGERMLPSIPALLDQPFWLDPRDRHHMAAAMQAESRPWRTIIPPPRAICGTTRSTTSASGQTRSIAS
jgi:ABC-type glycerol-3-phosphate transport system substrate-binding protein